MSTILSFLSHGNGVEHSLMDVAVMFVCGVVLYFFWDKILGH